MTHSLKDVQVFISYSHKDSAVVQELHKSVEKGGIRCWIDEISLSAGVTWRNEIAAAVKACKVFLICVSNSSSSSKYCMEELTLAYDEDKPIVPVFLADPTTVRLPDGLDMLLRRFHWTVFKENDPSKEEVVTFLLNGLRRKLIQAELRHRNSKEMCNASNQRRGVGRV